jgi:hypothetical protein
MPHHPHKSVTGTITHVFGHRLVLRTGDGDVLADLTPKGAERIALRLHDEVTIEGEARPSELKVARFTRARTTIEIEHPKKPGDDRTDPSIALTAARAAGYAIIGAPRRKPKHFELLGKSQGGFKELHIELNGHIRKSKPVARDDHKWSAELREAG